MKFQPRTLAAALCAAMLMSPALISGAAAQAAPDAPAQAAQAKPSWYPHRVDLSFVKQYAVLPKREGVTLVDSRPAARKYDVGHIPTAINIPDSQFDKLAPALLPKDKSQLVIFYCDGPECTLSHNSAFRAEKLGYTQVRVYAEGFPEWARMGESVARSAPQIEPGKEPGTIAIASFERIYKEAPGTVHLIDVREPREFAAGTFKNAINMPVSTLEASLDKLPHDKPIVFFCGAGGRSGEAHDMVRQQRPAIKTVFLDATIKWTSSGEYTIAAN